MAKELGFAAVGFWPPLSPPPHLDHFLAWLAEENYGTLNWLKRNVDVRQEPGKLLQGCRTIISLAMPYPDEQAETPDGFTVARYASSPVDYHLRMKRLCRELAECIQEGFPGSRFRIVVDSAPILERSIAFGAGLGHIGKNNMLIVPGHGSYVNLAEILTTAPIDFEFPKRLEGACGECDLCIQACPTGALEKPFFLDVSKCLAYLTVEHEGELRQGRVAMGRCFVGCDRCQEVCPLNSHRGESELLPLPSTEEFLGMDEPTFLTKLGSTGLRRAGLGRVKRNILAIRDCSPPYAPG